MKEKALSKSRGREPEQGSVIAGESTTLERASPRTTSLERWEPQGLSKTHRTHKRPAFNHIVLLLQGGGALGAYQAGVYEALAEADLHPDWVAGISIGAINAAIIAGNPPNRRVDRLREFWQGVTSPAAGLLHSLLSGGSIPPALSSIA